MAKKIILSLCLLIGCIAPLYPAEAVRLSSPQAAPLVRVALLQDAASFSLRVKGRFEVYDLNNKKLIAKASSLRKQAVKIRNNKIVIRGIPCSVSALQIAPLKGGYVFINDRVFRGRITGVRAFPSFPSSPVGESLQERSFKKTSKTKSPLESCK